MAKITELTSGTPALADVVAYVSDPGGTAVTKKSTVSSLLSTKGIVTVPLISSVPHKQLLIMGAKPTVTSGCAESAKLEMSTDKNNVDYLAFDKDTIEYAYANFVVPQDWKSGSTDIYAQFYWTHPSTTTNFKVSWGIQAVCVGDNSSLDIPRLSPIYSNDTGGTTYNLYISPLTSAVYVWNTPASGKLCQIRILRKADDATNDTLAVDAYLLGVMIWYPVA